MKNTIQIYPNPTSEKLFVRLPEKIKGSCEIKLIGFDGKQYLRKRVNTYLDKDYPIDLSDFPSGLYIMIYRSDNDYKSARVIIRK